MPNYSEWNKVIADYFTRNASKGSTVFLSLDDAALAHMAMSYFPQQLLPNDAVDDFKKAVRRHVIEHGVVDLEMIRGKDEYGIPKSIAFLGAMVLAAYQMADDIEVSDNNYFARLREVLGLSNNAGRPRGLTPAGVEVPLWNHWNRLLLQNDWLSSASEGPHVNTKYIHYPLSQAILRHGDAEKLEKLFRESEHAGGFRKNFDADQLMAWLRGRQLPSMHLRELLATHDLERLQAINSAIYEAYETVDWDISQHDGSRSGPALQRRLTAGLFRSHDPMSGTVRYKLYPPCPRRFSDEELTVHTNGESRVLHKDEDHRAWFEPLWPVSLHGGEKYEITGGSTIQELVVPERRFWILVRDPNNLDSRVYASWGSAESSDAPFLILCRAECSVQLDVLKDEDLLDWDPSIRRFEENGEEWLEYHNCVVIGFDWDGINPLDSELCAALKPIASAFLSLTGGLRVPNKPAWVAGHQPYVNVVSRYDDLVTLIIRNIDSDSEYAVIEDVQTNKTVSEFPVLPTGNYLLQIFGSSDEKLLLAQRQLRLADWSELRIAVPDSLNSILIGQYEILGGIVRQVADQEIAE